MNYVSLTPYFFSDVVRIELPEMEKQRIDLIVNINNDKQQLLFLEDKILKLLFSSKGNILDDEELVDTLNESKETSTIIAARLIDAEKTEQIITLEREKYRPLSAKGAILFFVVSSLAEIDPMYQFSLRYFTQVFCSVIEEEHLKMDFNERLNYLMTEETYAMYSNISRGLFERHKLIYSFLLAVAVEQHLGTLSQVQVDFLLRGAVGTKAELREKPENLKISKKQWINCLHLQHEFKEFEHLTEELDKKIVMELMDFKLEYS